MTDHKRRSLVDDAPASKPAKGSGGGGGKGGSMDPKDRMKMIAAIVIIIAAGVGLASYYGVFSSPPKDLPTVVQQNLTPEEQKEADELRKENEARIEEMIESGEAEKATAG